MAYQKRDQMGFAALIGLIITLAILILAIVWYTTGFGNKNEQKTPLQEGQAGINQAKDVNKTLLDQQNQIIDTQNELP